MGSATASAGDALRNRSALLPRIRLASGLVLMAYTVMHLLNHTLGLISLDALETGRRIFNLVWGPPVIEVLLLATFVLHGGLGLVRLWQRVTWRMPAWEALQLALGLMIPILGTLHILGTALLELCCQMRATYEFVLNSLWPDLAWRQTALTVAVWLHGCIGLHYWLRLRPNYRRFSLYLVVAAVLLPTLALLGFVEGARTVTERKALDPGWLASVASEQGWPGPEMIALIYRTETILVGGFLLLLAAILLGDLLRAAVSRSRSRIRISYIGDRTVSVPKGLSLLDASRMRGIPHAAVCGGRGRCSTCRVRITRGLADLVPPSPDEQRVLERIGAAPDVRLACQIRPTHNLTLVRLLPASASARDVMRRMDPNQGTEREIVVMFADLRGFTRLAESRLPYDVVYVLNRYFSAMGGAIEGLGGHVDKFVGDGIMALFGLDSPAPVAARSALAAAASMSSALVQLNRELGHDLGEPLRMGIGLHVGPAIVGELGWGRAVGLTAIGDTVNAASRLEALTKELKAELVLSERLARVAGVSLPAARSLEVDLRGRRDPVPVLALSSAAEAWPKPNEPTGITAPKPGWRTQLTALISRG
jgi:adenylate cyclase